MIELQLKHSCHVCRRQFFWLVLWVTLPWQVLYVGDVAGWTQSPLTLRTVSGLVKLVAARAALEGQATWVVQGGQILVDVLELSGTKLPDHIGADTSFEKGELTARDSAFLDNENGILNRDNPNSALTIENSEFAFSGSGDGQLSPSCPGGPYAQESGCGK